MKFWSKLPLSVPVKETLGYGMVHSIAKDPQMVSVQTGRVGRAFPKGRGHGEHNSRQAFLSVMSVVLLGQVQEEPNKTASRISQNLSSLCRGSLARIQDPHQ
jgi:hypothetical protein